MAFTTHVFRFLALAECAYVPCGCVGKNKNYVGAQQHGLCLTKTELLCAQTLKGNMNVESIHHFSSGLTSNTISD